MSKRFQFKMSERERRTRTFSVEFRQSKVREIERGTSRISDICREYEVSETTIRRWLQAYGKDRKTQARIIVEAESDTRKILELKTQIAELERLVGQKQVQLEFKDKMIELAEQMYGVDIKKKFGAEPSSGSGNIANTSR